MFWFDMPFEGIFELERPITDLTNEPSLSVCFMNAYMISESSFLRKYFVTELTRVFWQWSSCSVILFFDLSNTRLCYLHFVLNWSSCICRVEPCSAFNCEFFANFACRKWFSRLMPPGFVAQLWPVELWIDAEFAKQLKTIEFFNFFNLPSLILALE